MLRLRIELRITTITPSLAALVKSMERRNLCYRDLVLKFLNMDNVATRSGRLAHPGVPKEIPQGSLEHHGQRSCNPATNERQVTGSLLGDIARIIYGCGRKQLFSFEHINLGLAILPLRLTDISSRWGASLTRERFLERALVERMQGVVRTRFSNPVDRKENQILAPMQVQDA